MEASFKKPSRMNRILATFARSAQTAQDKITQTLAKGLLPMVWGAAIVGAAALATSFHGKSEYFYGIVGSKEQVISFQYPVEIVKVHVVEGKGVATGQQLVEVKRYDLSAGQNTLQEQIKRVSLQKRESTNTLSSQVANLTAQRDASLADVDSQIHAIERKLTALESISGIEKHSVPANPPELIDLRQKRHSIEKASQAEIANLNSQLNAGSRPIDAQIAELQQIKTESQRQTEALKVGALFDGRVSSINFKVGELVPAYQPILTVHSRTPADIKGYIHENVLNEVKVGQTVWVKSIGSTPVNPTHEAVVEGLGNRIVEYPVRLRRNQAVTAWGREVVVKLKNEDNALLFGEKVELSLVKKSDWPMHTLMGTANANTQSTRSNTKIQSDDSPRTMLSDNEKIQTDAVEASGIWWNANESHYLMVSDEVYDNKPAIFIVNENMRITQQLKMHSPIEMDDLESISSDGEYVYVLSSLSYNKNNKLKAKRKKLVRFKYHKDSVTSQQEVDLYEVLVDLGNVQTKTRLSTFLQKALSEHSQDIEAHFVKDGNLYIGFKAPHGDSKTTVIVELSNVATLFSGQKVAGKIWKEIELNDPETGKPSHLSDMVIIKDKIYMLSGTGKSVKNSFLWSYGLEDGKLSMRKKFPGVIAEGLAYRTDIGAMAVVFDEGNQKQSKYQTLKFSDIEN
jgi:multidrug resistance efflux pump